MNTVIRSLFKHPELTGSSNRPDFVILPSGSLGCYSYPKFGSLSDETECEQSVERLVIVELKRPGVAISTDEKAQCWKYVKELMEKGMVSVDTRIDCYVLGDSIDPSEAFPRRENRDNCIITPFHYDLIIAKARSRLLQLQQRVQNAPFMKSVVAQFESDAAVVRKADPELFKRN